MNALLHLYPGDAWAILTANVLVQVTVVILAAGLLARLGNRWNAARRHTIFLIALLAVLASPVWSSLMPASGFSWLTVRTNAPAAHPQIQAARVPQSAAIETPAQPPVVGHPVDLESPKLGQISPLTQRLTHSFSDLLRACGGLAVLVWLVGVAFQLARWCHGLWLIAALRREVRPLDCQALDETIQQVRQALGNARLPRLATSAGVDRPIMVGLIRPLVILPEDALPTLRAPQLADILIHECAHAVCLHPVAVLLERVAETLFWFHPLVHWLNRQLARAREEVCDNYVLGRSDAPRYARTLLTLAESLVDTSPKRAALGLFHARWTLESRVADLLDRRRRAIVRVNRPTAAALVALFLLLGLAIAGTTIVQAEPPVTQPPVTQPPAGQESALRGARTAPALLSTLPIGKKPPANAHDNLAGEIYAVRFSPDGLTLASSWGDGTIKLWDVASRRAAGVFVSRKAHAEEKILVRSLAFSPDGQAIAAANTGGSTAGTVRMWNVAIGKNTATFNGHPDEPWRADMPGIYCMLFTNNGKTLVTGSEDNLIRLWDAASGKVTAEWQAEAGDSVYALALSPDGKTLASGSHRGRIKLWDMASGTCTATYQAVPKGNGIFSIAFSPDGKTLGAAGWMDGGGMLWDIASGTNTMKFKPDKADSVPLNNVNDMTYSIAFSPDGKLFAQGCDNGLIVLWDLPTRQKIAALIGHSDIVRTLAFSPDGNTLASGSDDSTVKLWGFSAGGERAEKND